MSQLWWFSKETEMDLAWSAIQRNTQEPPSHYSDSDKGLFVIEIPSPKSWDDKMLQI